MPKYSILVTTLPERGKTLEIDAESITKAAHLVNAAQDLFNALNAVYHSNLIDGDSTLMRQATRALSKARGDSPKPKVCPTCGSDSKQGCAESDCENDWTEFWA